MPMLDIYIPAGALTAEAEAALLVELTDILLTEEGVDPANERARELAWIFVHRPDAVWVAGEASTDPHYKVVSSVPEGQYTGDRRRRMVSGVTAAIAKAEPAGRANAEQRVWVFAHQIPEATWGARGRIWGLADIVNHVLENDEAANAYAPRAIATTRAEHANIVPAGTEPFDVLPSAPST